MAGAMVVEATRPDTVFATTSCPRWPKALSSSRGVSVFWIWRPISDREGESCGGAAAADMASVISGTTDAAVTLDCLLRQRSLSSSDSFDTAMMPS